MTSPAPPALSLIGEIRPRQAVEPVDDTIGPQGSRPRGLRRDLHLYDARGTAATRLLDAGADLKEIAVHMGWSLKHAAEVIERYVALSPAMSDTLAAKLKRAESRTKLQTTLQTGKAKK